MTTTREDLQPEAGTPEIQPPPALIRENSGFNPPATVLVGCLLAATGAFLMLLGTTALRLPRGAQLSFGMQISKMVLGLMVSGAGVGMILLAPWSRNVVRAMLVVGGLLLPLYPWEANPLGIGLFEVLSRAIDWEFAWTFRGLVFLTSTILVGYLSRPSVARAFENGGVEARFEGYVCAGCNGTEEHYRKEGCDVCGGPLFEQYRSPGGFCYLREVRSPVG